MGRGYGGYGNDLPMFICNLTTGTVIKLPVYPESIDDNNSANFDSISIRGRSSPLRAYDSSGPRSISVSFKMHEDFTPGGLQDMVNSLRALTYPKYSSRVYAPKVYARFAMISFYGICTSVGINWEPPIRDGQYLVATVDLSFETTEDTAPSASEVEYGMY